MLEGGSLLCDEQEATNEGGLEEPSCCQDLPSPVPYQRMIARGDADLVPDIENTPEPMERRGLTGNVPNDIASKRMKARRDRKIQDVVNALGRLHRCARWFGAAEAPKLAELDMLIASVITMLHQRAYRLTSAVDAEVFGHWNQLGIQMAAGVTPPNR